MKHCKVCGRPLKNLESIEMGIGPGCARKMGLMPTRLGFLRPSRTSGKRAAVETMYVYDRPQEDNLGRIVGIVFWEHVKSPCPVEFDLPYVAEQITWHMLTHKLARPGKYAVPIYYEKWGDEIYLLETNYIEIMNEQPEEINKKLFANLIPLDREKDAKTIEQIANLNKGAQPNENH